MSASRQILDPELYYQEHKDTFIDVDLLDEDHDVPKSQAWAVVSFVEPDPCFAQLKEVHDTLEFHKQFGDKILKHVIKKKDYRFYYDRYKEFKILNYKSLKQSFEKKYGTTYDMMRQYKLYGCYPSEEAANKRASKIAKNNNFHSIFVQQTGFWVPFNPPEELCKDSKSRDERMNKIMHAHIWNKKRMNEYVQGRKQALIEKTMKDAGAKRHRSETENGVEVPEPDKRTLTDKELEEEFERLDPSYTIDMMQSSKTEEKKILKDLVETEIKLDNADIINPEFAKKVGVDKSLINKIEKAKAERETKKESQQT